MAENGKTVTSSYLRADRAVDAFGVLQDHIKESGGLDSMLQKAAFDAVPSGVAANFSEMIRTFLNNVSELFARFTGGQGNSVQQKNEKEEKRKEQATQQQQRIMLQQQMEAKWAAEVHNFAGMELTGKQWADMGNALDDENSPFCKNLEQDLVDKYNISHDDAKDAIRTSSKAFKAESTSAPTAEQQAQQADYITKSQKRPDLFEDIRRQTAHHLAIPENAIKSGLGNPQLGSTSSQTPASWDYIDRSPATSTATAPAAYDTHSRQAQDALAATTREEARADFPTAPCLTTNFENACSLVFAQKETPQTGAKVDAATDLATDATASVQMKAAPAIAP